MDSESSQTHPELLNPRFLDTRTFTSFPELPPEIRSAIWEQALCHERLIPVTLYRPKLPTNYGWESPRTKLLQTTFSFKSPDDMIIVFEERKDVSKLFRVCYESRQAALRFYRVHVPCYYLLWDGLAREGVFYFNPELDIIQPSHLELMPKFANMLWARDPRQVGLINIALFAGIRPYQFKYLLRSEQDETLVRQALNRLRRVIFVFEGSLERGKGKKWLQPEDLYPRTRLSTSAFIPRTHLAQSHPMRADVSKFQRLPMDHRDIEPVLKNLVFFGNPRRQPRFWFHILDRFGVSHPEGLVHYQCMLALTNTAVSNRRSALQRIQEQKKLWSQWHEAAGTEGGACENRSVVLPAAFGFWLFPMYAFPPEHVTTDVEVECLRWRWLNSELRSVVPLDVSKHPPELCLQYLPE